MFKLEPNPTFEATVRIPVPGGDAAPLRLVFKHRRKSEVQQLVEAAAGREDIDLVADIVAGWHDVDAPFDRKHLAALLDAYPAAAGAILQAWGAELSGAAAKN